jgi:hypothetical protein
MYNHYTAIAFSSILSKRRPTPRSDLCQMTAERLNEIFILGHVLFTWQIFADSRIAPGNLNTVSISQ